ncbi:MAG: DoxX family membrane protein [Thermoleophilia bacterium]|nr:DoxX family membrane protein [Thermoleophilia bacterium]
MKLGRLLARLFIGSLFFAHGAQKPFGWFGGSGPEATGETMD